MIAGFFIFVYQLKTNIKMENEVWMPVFGFEATHQVSDHGRVRSLRKTRDHKILKPCNDGRGYHIVCIRAGRGVKITKTVHRLVAIAF